MSINIALYTNIPQGIKMTQYNSLAESLGEIKVKIYEIRRLYLLEEGVPKKVFYRILRAVLGDKIPLPLWAIQVILDRLGQFGSFLAPLDHFGPFWPPNIVPNIGGVKFIIVHDRFFFWRKKCRRETMFSKKIMQLTAIFVRWMWLRQISTLTVLWYLSDLATPNNLSQKFWIEFDKKLSPFYFPTVHIKVSSACYYYISLPLYRKFLV